MLITQDKGTRFGAVKIIYIAALVAVISISADVSISNYPQEIKIIRAPIPLPNTPKPEAKEESVATSTNASTTPKVAPVKIPVAVKNEPKQTPPKTIITVYSQASSSLAVSSIPLLTGGVAKAGKSVPISYLQVTNTGSDTVTLKGFWVRQNGNAPTQAIIGLTTIDDKGGSKGSTAIIEGSTPFQNGAAFAPTNATFAPGQLKLFTIKAVLSNDLSQFVGKDMVLSVTSLDASVPVQGMFPIQGTTWTLAN